MTVNDQLVGMIHGAFSDNLPVCITKYIPLHTPAVVQSINADLADLQAKNRPGAGFVPGPRLSTWLLGGSNRVEHARVEQRGGVAEFALLGDVAQQTSHDLAAAGLRQLGYHVQFPRSRDR